VEVGVGVMEAVVVEVEGGRGVVVEEREEGCV
jgi:hypothetical protein